MPFTVATVVDALKSFDYLALAKLLVPYDELRSSALLVTLAHLLIFGILLGTLVWVTFISGIVLFKNLPKQIFGQAQSHLFPWYFRVCSFCLFSLFVCVFIEQHDLNVVRATFTRLYLAVGTPADFDILLQFLQPFFRLTQTNVQLGLLLAAWLTSVSQQLLIGPLVTKYMNQRHQLNDELAKPGQTQNAKLLKQLKGVSGKFGALHGISSLMNMFILCAALAHGLYFATVLKAGGAAATIKAAAGARA